MKNTLRYFFFALLACCVIPDLSAQFELVEYSRQNGWFNNGQALPAESNMILTGSLPPKTDRVIVGIYKAEEAGAKAPLYSAVWSRDVQISEDLFRLPISFPLKGSDNYDFMITYYSSLSATEKDKVTKTISEELKRYISQYAFAGSDNQEVISSPKKMVEGMNTIVAKGLASYQTVRETSFPGFSETVLQGLKNLETLEGKTPAQNPSEPQIKRSKDYTDQLEAIMVITAAEWKGFMDQPVLVVSDVRTVTNYPTESTRNTLAINAGYGGVYLSGDLSDLSYGASPYVGISLPLSSRSTAPAFLKNTAVSLGVFTNNFETAEGNTVTGPIFGRPYYLGVGYNVFRFVRLNIGATALETVGSSSVGGGTAGIDVNGITVRPFIGLSAELDVWAGLRR